MRLATIDFTPALSEHVTEAVFTESIEPLLLKHLEDSVHSIRIEAINCLIKLKNQQKNQAWLQDVVAKKLEEFSSHPRFSIRIHTLFCINNVISEVTDQFLNETLFKKFIKKLAADPVPNIRFNVAKTVQVIHPRLSNSSKMVCVEFLKKMQESDADFDVKFFANKTLMECFPRDCN